MMVSNEFFRSLNIDLHEQCAEAVQWLSERGKFEVGGSQSCEPMSKASYVLWFPNNPESPKTTAIVSSRLGRELDSKDAFFRILRVACSQLEPRCQAILSSAGIATDPYVVRAAELFGLRVLSVAIGKSKTIESWLLQIAATDEKTRLATKCFVSPPMPKATLSQPVRDEVVIGQADQVLAIHVRPGGSIASLIQQRLDERSPAKVYLAVGGEGLVARNVADPMMERGAVGWFVTSNETEVSTFAPLVHANPKHSEQQQIIPLSEFKKQERYLAHCTRNANGPWPDQSEADFLDELILGSISRDRSALAALMRIVGQRRILATGDAIRKNTPVVSLTAVPLRELSSLRRFRSHRGRWDFEPYGVAIDREHLTKQGAREVIYGSEATWENLAVEDQPFFQKLGGEANSIDWRVEREFRVMTDINLERVPSDQAVVFVPTQEEAEHVARISGWPVVVTK